MSYLLPLVKKIKYFYILIIFKGNIFFLMFYIFLYMFFTILVTMAAPHLKFSTRFSPLIGAYYNGPKFKCQPTSGTGWFSYKIWTKNSKTPIVNLFKNLRPFWNYIFKYNWKSIFWLFQILTKTLQKKS